MSLNTKHLTNKLMNPRMIAHNIKVDNILRVLSAFQDSDYVDIMFIPGTENTSDVIKISPSGFNPDTIKEWFSLKHINDFI